MSENDRRHRIHGDEVDAAIQGMTLLLETLCHDKKDLTLATQAFHLWWRLVIDRVGHPGYPEETWQTIEDSISFGTVLPLQEEADKICSGDGIEESGGTK